MHLIIFASNLYFYIDQMRQMASAEDAGYPHEHLIHTFMSTSAACVLPVLVCSALTYFMVITSYNWWRFFLVTLISLVLNQTWISVYMMMTYANPRYATQVNLMAAILAGFAGGFIVTKPQMPIGWVAMMKYRYARRACANFDHPVSYPESSSSMVSA